MAEIEEIPPPTTWRLDPLPNDNEQFAAAARALLLHEYVHLLLHTSGLRDLITDLRATDPNGALEARCNAVAAAILMPQDLVLARPEVDCRRALRDSWNYAALRDAAAPGAVSRRIQERGRSVTVRRWQLVP